MVAANVEEGWEGKMAGVHTTQREEGDEDQLELNRWQARIAALRSIPRMMNKTTAASMGREAGPIGGYGHKSSVSSSSPATSDSPSFRAVQGGQRSKKRKSPCSGNIMFRSPLSKMMLSPRPGTQSASSPRFSSMENPNCKKPSHMIEQGTSFVPSHRVFRSPLSRMMLSPRVWIRSPFSSQGASSSTTIPRSRKEPLEIDLNIPVCDDLSDVEQELQVSETAPPTTQAGRKEVSKETRKAICDFLLAKSNNGELKGHETREASTKFSVNIRTVQRIWKKEKHRLDQGTDSSRKSGRGRKKKEVDLSKLRGLPITSRGTLEDVAKELGISKTKLHSMKREGVIQRVSSSLKPLLTDMNKKERLKWCISMLEDPMSSDPVFKCLFDFVFIDEKWFNITRNTQRYYKVPDEEQPERTCKNKNYIKKIMILCAYARSRFDSQGNCTFDGKIGCFPFVVYEAAKRSSKNRRAGTIEMKPMDSIKTKESREFLIDKVLPAIRAKWPREDVTKPIYIQQDNAPSHVAPTDKFFCEAAKKDGFDITLISQPPNSPDLNILDLGFFNSIQSIQYKTSAKTTEELVAAVHKAFDDYPPCKANRIFLTLHGCMKEIIRVGGGNNYGMPHIRKEMLERQGRLPIQLSCDAALVNHAKAQIAE